ncbi:MAG: hypothetical protein K2G77_03050, partial [Muribaculaceae bacterium]|nr:hypothetical protein [Muribaculaceae bacterium]
SLLTLDPSKLSEITKLCGELKLSLKRPTSRTLRLIDRALSYLTPFESPKASVVSPSEKQDLLQLLDTHRDILCPYINIDKIEHNLKSPLLPH